MWGLILEPFFQLKLFRSKNVTDFCCGLNFLDKKMLGIKKPTEVGKGITEE